MIGRILLGAALIIMSFIAGWFAHTRGDAPITSVTEIHHIAAKQRAESQRDSASAVKWLTRYDTLYDSVAYPVWDTVWVTKFIHVADSTIFACKTALGSCWALNRSLDSIISAQDQVIQNAEPRRSTWLRWGERSLWFAGGYSACRAMHHPP